MEIEKLRGTAGAGLKPGPYAGRELWLVPRPMHRTERTCFGLGYVHVYRPIWWEICRACCTVPLRELMGDDLVMRMRGGWRWYGWICVVAMALCTEALGAAEQEARIAPRGVELTALDGTKLKGTFYQAAGAGPGVLLLHQCNQTRKNWEGLATQLQAVGLNVFTVDYRGYGESGGTPMKELKPEEWRPMVEKKFPSDVDVALEYLEAQPVVTRHIIGIGGASCSVNQAIQAASRHPEVKTLVLLSGTTNHAGRAFLRQSGKVPMLFVVSDDDKDVSWKFTQWLYSLSKNPGSRFVHYQTGGHGTELFEAHKGLPGTIVDWFV